MHKELLLLGLLRRGPMSGYDLHRIVVAHGDLYADLKKGNVYYLLERLAGEGLLTVQTETKARGPRGERLIYALTAQGRTRFQELLGAVVSTYEPAHMGIEVAVIFLGALPDQEVRALLTRRRVAVQERRAVATNGFGAMPTGLLEQLAQDHLLALMDAELAWIDRSLARLPSA
jgi:DNA-binding PadR family transcriptional regulator